MKETKALVRSAGQSQVGGGMRISVLTTITAFVLFGLLLGSCDKNKNIISSAESKREIEKAKIDVAKDKQDKVDALTKEKDEAVSKVRADKDTQIATLTEEVSQANRDRDAAQGQLAKYKAQDSSQDATRQQLDRANRERDEAQCQLVALTTERDEAVRSREQAERDLGDGRNAVRRDLERAQRERDAAVSAKEQAEGDMARTREAVDGERSQLEARLGGGDLEQAAAAAERSRKKLEAVERKWKAENKILEDQRSKANVLKRSAESKVNALTEELKIVREENEKLKQVAGVEEEANNIKAQKEAIYNLKCELDSEKRMAEKMAEKIKDMEAEAKSMAWVTSTLRKNIRELEKEIAELKEKVGQAKTFEDNAETYKRVSLKTP